jgi:hypothetical protein
MVARLCNRRQRKDCGDSQGCKCRSKFHFVNLLENNNLTSFDERNRAHVAREFSRPIRSSRSIHSLRESIKDANSKRWRIGENREGQ